MTRSNADGSQGKPDSGVPPLARSRSMRGVLLGTGFVFVGLAALGALLPLLPTTPFLLLAAACFARSSPRFYQWLLDNRLFGALLREWRATHSIPRNAKITAIGMIVLVGGSSVVFFLANPWIQGGVTLVLLALIVWLLRIPTSRPRNRDADPTR